MPEFIKLDPSRGVALNPAAEMSAPELETFLRTACSYGLSLPEQVEIEDQIEALAPAIVELRDAGHIKLNMSVIASYGKLDGFIQLADDVRLTDLSRNRCRAIRDRLVVLGVKQILGHD